MGGIDKDGNRGRVTAFGMKDLPQQPDPESVSQLSKEELVFVVKEPQKIIEQLRQEIEGLKVSRDKNSQTSSKPPSSDLLKKLELKKPDLSQTPDTEKRKPGGQPGHQGKTRIGFGRVDRYEILRPQVCTECGHTEFDSVPVKVEK